MKRVVALKCAFNSYVQMSNGVQMSLNSYVQISANKSLPISLLPQPYNFLLPI